MGEKRLLFSAHPDLKESIPYVQLADLPTPVEHKPMMLPDSRSINNLWIKRDDKTSALYGGNKVRKLEYIIADIHRRGVSKVVTFGGTGTNQGVATSLYCGQHGISTPEADDAIKCFDSVGINLETTYTAKAAVAAVKCCHENSAKRILYWHTYNSSDTSGLVDTTRFDRIPEALRNLLE